MRRQLEDMTMFSAQTLYVRLRHAARWCRRRRFAALNPGRALLQLLTPQKRCWAYHTRLGSCFMLSGARISAAGGCGGCPSRIAAAGGAACLLRLFPARPLRPAAAVSRRR